MPYGLLKSWGANGTPWEPFQPSWGNLNPATYMLVKKGELLATDQAAATEAGGAGLSAGAVAGKACRRTDCCSFKMGLHMLQQQQHCLCNGDMPRDESAACSGCIQPIEQVQ